MNALALSHVMGPVYLMIGLSILMYAKVWHHLLQRWSEDHLQLFTLKFVYAVLGLVVINMYNVWEWNVWLIVTVTGWALLVKSVFYFLMPGSVIKQLLSWKGNMSMMYICGVVALVAGAALTYYSYFV